MRIGKHQSSPRSIPKESTRPPTRSLQGMPMRHGKTLAWPASKTLAAPPDKTLVGGDNGATARRAPTNSPAAVRMQLPAQPAGQAPAWQHAASRPAQHAPTWWHADLHGGSTTAPPQLLACLRGTACIAGQGVYRSKEERRRTGWASLPSSIK